MKKLYCFKCNTYLGEIEKGKFKKDMYFLCAMCKGAIDLGGIKNNSNTPSGMPTDMPDCFGDLFNNFGGKK